jgi:hypothetical protein
LGAGVGGGKREREGVGGVSGRSIRWPKGQEDKRMAMAFPPTHPPTPTLPHNTPCKHRSLPHIHTPTHTPSPPTQTYIHTWRRAPRTCSARRTCRKCPPCTPARPAWAWTSAGRSGSGSPSVGRVVDTCGWVDGWTVDGLCRTNRSVNQSINQSINQPTNQSMHRPVDQSMPASWNPPSPRLSDAINIIT